MAAKRAPGRGGTLRHFHNGKEGYSFVGIVPLHSDFPARPRRNAFFSPAQPFFARGPCFASSGRPARIGLGPAGGRSRRSLNFSANPVYFHLKYQGFAGKAGSGPYGDERPAIFSRRPAVETSRILPPSETLAAISNVIPLQQRLGGYRASIGLLEPSTG